MNHPEIKTPVTVDATRQFVNAYFSERKRRKRLQTQILFTATKEQLSCPECYLHLWRTIRSLTHLSAAKLIDAMEAFFRDLDMHGIEVRYPDTGEFFVIPYIDDIFPCVESEAGRRWINDYKRPFQGGVRHDVKPEILNRLICMELIVHATVAKYTRGSDTPRCSMTHFPLGW